jgi:hypothetical protein
MLDLLAAFVLGMLAGALLLWVVLRAKLTAMMRTHREILANVEEAWQLLGRGNKEVERMRQEFRARLDRMR